MFNCRKVPKHADIDKPSFETNAEVNEYCEGQSQML